MKHFWPILWGMLGVLLLIGLFLLWSVAARAQVVCGPHDKVVEMLGIKFDEYLTSRALAGNDALVETFTSAKGTWTQLISNSNHIACIAGAGESWEAFDPAKHGDKT